ncbi:MAG: ribonuclease H-like domain-containing protein [Chitinophagales bacterium]|nr:ribonuclease H-like domain-containing protein [Chitinophagales bacterium]
MLDNIHLNNLICIDIETVPGYPDFESVPLELKELYLNKSARLKAENESKEDQYFNHASIYAEFGKIVCISIGIFNPGKQEMERFRIKSFAGSDEKILLQLFTELLNTYYKKPDKYFFCGYNIKEFDIPYLCRRMLINGLELPKVLDISGKKPYEVYAVDIMQLWRFGDYKHFTSLKLLSAVMGIASPKDDLDGKDVGKVFWKENDLSRIVTYCQKDVITVAQLLLRFKGLPLLNNDDYKIVE